MLELDVLARISLPFQVERLSVMVEKTLRYAWTISKEIHFVHVACDEDEDASWRQRWSELVEAPAREARLPVPELVILKSPFRFVVAPIMEYALRLQGEHPERNLAVLVPELIEQHWYEFPLHNNRPQMLRGLLNQKENPRITVINIPWFLNAAKKDC